MVVADVGVLDKSEIDTVAGHPVKTFDLHATPTFTLLVCL